MKRTLLLLLPSVLLVLAATAISLRTPTRYLDDDTCYRVLEKGVFETTSFDKQKSFRSNLVTWLKRLTKDEAEKMVKTEGTVVIPIEGVPVGLSYKNFERDWKKFEEMRDEGKIEEVRAEEAESFYMTRASKDIVQAWSDCQKERFRQRKFGLNSETSVQSDILQVEIEWRPTAPAAPTALRGVQSKNLIVPQALKPDSFKLEPNSPQLYAFEVIDPKNSAFIILAFDGGSASAFYFPIPSEPSPSPRKKEVTLRLKSYAFECATGLQFNSAYVQLRFGDERREYGPFNTAAGKETNLVIRRMMTDEEFDRAGFDIYFRADDAPGGVRVPDWIPVVSDQRLKEAEIRTHTSIGGHNVRHVGSFTAMRE